MGKEKASRGGWGEQGGSTTRSIVGQGLPEGHPERDAEGYADITRDLGAKDHAANNHTEYGPRKSAYPHADKLPRLHAPAFPLPMHATI